MARPTSATTRLIAMQPNVPNDRALIYISTETDEERVRLPNSSAKSAHGRSGKASASRRRTTRLIYVPMIAQATFAILAAQPASAPFPWSFGGALRLFVTRIDDAKPTLIVSSDAGMRGGRLFLTSIC